MCEQLAQSCYLIMTQLGIEPVTMDLIRVRCYTTKLLVMFVDKFNNSPSLLAHLHDEDITYNSFRPFNVVTGGAMRHPV